MRSSATIPVASTACLVCTEGPAAATTAAARSIGAGSHFEMRGLAEAAHIPRQPVGRPINHDANRNLWIAKQAFGEGRVGNPGRRRLLPYQDRSLAEATTEGERKCTDTQRLGTGDIERSA